MNKTWVTLAAAILFIGSFVAFGYARSNEGFTEHGSEWSALDFVAIVMFVSALGCSVAAYKLPDDEDDDEEG